MGPRFGRYAGLGTLAFAATASRVWAQAPASEAAPAASGATTTDVVVHGVRRTREGGVSSVSAKEAAVVPGTEGDPVKIVESLPGVARPAFDAGQILLWGAGPDDTRTYVDGVPIPSLFHGAGLRSTVNGSLVRDVTVFPGAYGADFGRSIGGIVRVETVELPASGVHGYAGADTLDASAMLSVAPSEQARIAVAGRLGYLDRLLRAVDSPDVGDYFAIPSYRDYQAKLQLELPRGDTLDAVLLGSSDELTRTIPAPDPARARRESLSSAFQRVYLHYRRALEDGAVVEVTPYVGRDTSSLDQAFGAIPASLEVAAWRWGVRASYREVVASSVAVSLGADVDGTNARLERDGSLSIPAREGDVTVFGRPPGADVGSDAWSASVVDVAPYAIADVVLGPLSLTGGLRASAMLLEASRQTPRVGLTPPIGLAQLEPFLEPRAAARLRIGQRLSLIAAAGAYHQPPAPQDLSAVFGSPSLGAESAKHLSAGTIVSLSRTLSLETLAFYKWMDHLAVRDPAPTPKLAAALVQDGEGRAYGTQTMLRQRPWKGFSGWIAYTISRSERRDAPDARWRPFDFDQSHLVTAVASKELGHWTIGARLRFATGLPRTPVIGSFYDVRDDAHQPVFGAQNSARLPDFWQLDVRVDRAFELAEAVRLLVYLEGLDVTARRNAEEYVYNASYTRRSTITGLPAMAVVGARIEL